VKTLTEGGSRVGARSRMVDKELQALKAAVEAEPAAEPATARP